jgi:hypothetical protein
LIVSLFGPWYYFSVEASESFTHVEIKNDYYFDKFTMHGEFSYAGDIDKTYYYTDAEFEKNNNFIDTMGIARGLTILGIVFSVLGLISMMLYANYLAFKSCFIFFVLALIFSLLPAVYVMIALPSAIPEEGSYFIENQKNEFFGSEEMMGVKMNWGGSWGWWAAMFAGIFCIIGFIIFIIHASLFHPIGVATGKTKRVIRRRWI